jgi:hypothetical protein
MQSQMPPDCENGKKVAAVRAAVLVSTHSALMLTIPDLHQYPFLKVPMTIPRSIVINTKPVLHIIATLIQLINKCQTFVLLMVEHVVIGLLLLQMM